MTPILWATLCVVARLYLLVHGVVDISQIGAVIVYDAVFAVAFLTLYPYRAACDG